MSATVPPRRRWRWALLAVVLLFGLPVAALVVFAATFDAAAWTPRLTAAVEAATGRRLAIEGPVSARLSLWPTLRLEGVRLANAADGSRPEMATLARAEVQFAVLPLLSRRIELRRVLLTGADLLLETDAEGRPNWLFPRAPRPADDAPAAASGRPLGVEVAELGLRDSRVTWRDGRTGRSVPVEIPRLDLVGAGATLRLVGRLALAGLTVQAEGEAGGLDAWRAGGDWPFRLALTAEGARATTTGRRAAGRWAAELTANVSDPGPLEPFRPAGVPRPPPFDLVAEVSVAEGEAPVVGALRVVFGALDLGTLQVGGQRSAPRLARLEATRSHAGAPLGIVAEGSVTGGEPGATPTSVPVRLVATLGPIERLLATGAAPAEPWPFDVAIGLGEAGPAEAAMRVRGGLADPRVADTADAEMALRVPSLALLSPVLGAGLPTINDVALDTRVRVPPPGATAPAPAAAPAAAPGAAPGAASGVSSGEGPDAARRVAVLLSGLRLTSSAGDATGELAIVSGPRPGVSGMLASRRLDVTAGTARATAGPAGAPAGVPGAPRPAAADRLIPAVALPSLAALRAVDAALRWTVAELVLPGATLRDVEATIALADGRLRLEPLVASVPGGRLTLRIAADGTAAPPAVQVAATGAGLDLAALLGTLGLPARAAGRLDLDLNLRGAGADTRALAATLTGHLGAAVVDGRLDGALLAGLPADLRRILLPGGGEGPIALRCLALRAEAAGGVARPRTLLLDTAIGRLGGEGTVDLRDERLGLRLLPDLRVAGFTVRAPVTVGGTLLAPRVGVAPEAAIAGGLGAFLSLQTTPDPGLAGIAGALGGGAAALPDCGPALAVARGGQPGPQPARAATLPPGAGGTVPLAPSAGLPGLPRGLPPVAGELLRGLLGR